MAEAAGDPGCAIQDEVERGMASMIEQHTTWLDLCAAGQRGEEFEWRTAELLSCLRAIEWDLQDLEDAVSIVEGNRKKFSLDDDAIATRKTFIETIRSKIDTIRSSVQDSSQSEGHAAAKKGLAAKMSAPIAAAKGYGKLPKEQAPETPKPTSPKGEGGSVNVDRATDGDLPEGALRSRKWYAWCC